MHVSELLSLTHSPKLVRIGTVKESGLHEWMRDANFAPEADNNSILLNVFNFDFLMSCWAADTSRLLSAARATLQAITSTKDKPKATAWILIKAYYASFYYAHVALRINRVSLTYSPTRDFIKLRELLDVYGVRPPFKLKTNQYVLNFSERTSTVRITQKIGGDGTHENTWAAFLELLDQNARFAFDSQSSDSDKKIVSELVSMLRTSVTYNPGDGRYLSSFRNEIQYTQRHGVWPPYSGKLRLDHCLKF
jgi:hypothetical protein